MGVPGRPGSWRRTGCTPARHQPHPTGRPLFHRSVRCRNNPFPLHLGNQLACQRGQRRNPFLGTQRRRRCENGRLGPTNTLPRARRARPHGLHACKRLAQQFPCLHARTPHRIRNPFRTDVLGMGSRSLDLPYIRHRPTRPMAPHRARAPPGRPRPPTTDPATPTAAATDQRAARLGPPHTGHRQTKRGQQQADPAKPEPLKRIKATATTSPPPTHSEPHSTS